jgi:2-(1,2-epoxy-1,2-dihydrophenyl)acetyl-CoA isomerase
MPDYQTIIAERRGDVLQLTLNRPDRLNAASLDMADELNAALDRLDGARAVLITGAGRAFCSGADLAARGERSVGGGQASHAALTRHYNPLMMKLAELDVPTVAAVNGPAAGIGCSIALACDFVVAGASAYFLQAFVNIGLVPDAGATWLLPRLAGRARALEMMLLGERISAEKAAEWGMISRVVDDEFLAEESLVLAANLARGPTKTLGLIRRLARDAEQLSLSDALAAERVAQREAGRTEDFKGAVFAFLQKRQPTFQGH